MKLLVSMLLFSSLSFAGVDEGFKLKCVWQKSTDHVKGFFVKDVGFTLELIENKKGDVSKAKISEDTFFNRTYTPCYTGGFKSCAFAFSYDEDAYWAVDDLNDILTQSWRENFVTDYKDGSPEEKGTVDGVSTIAIITTDKDGYTILKGDDGDGTFFEEKFACKLLDF